LLKIIPLLLTALGLVSAAAYAAPELTVTNFGQSIETENVSGGAEVDDLWLWNTVGLKYDDWSFSLTAGKKWAVNTYNKDKKDNDDNFVSDNSRLQFDFSKPLTENFNLTGRYRGQKNFDRFQIGYNYSYGMFLSSGDVFYDFNDDKNTPDAFHAELFPIGVKLGPVTLKYYFEYVENLGEIGAGEQENSTEHQIRLYAPLYKGERLSLSTEGRFTLTADQEWKAKDGKATGYNHFDDFGRNRLYLKSNYAVSENLDVYLNVGYEIREFKGEDGAKDDNNKYWSNVAVGYNYKF